MIAVLFPRFDHPAIEERYGSWQSQALLRRGGDVEFVLYDPEEPAALAAARVQAELVLVVVDPLLLPSPALPGRLSGTLETSGAEAALPVSNEAENPEQRSSPEAPYLTLRELQELTTRLESRPAETLLVVWDHSDPGTYLCRRSLLESTREVLRSVLTGRPVALSRNDYVHRWIPMRAEMRDDLLPLVPADAKAIIELGCGEAPLGAAIKARQTCRMVGVEIDSRAAAVARGRIDEVYCGDVRHVVSILDEKFDCIIGSEIIEHVDDPWSLLCDLRAIASPGGQLLLSIPNVANASLIGDLLHGRFDYAYIGLACVGHLRFFTRSSIEEMLTIAGWDIVAMTSQRAPSAAGDALVERLQSARIDLTGADLTATGYYVVARNRS